MSRFLLSDAAAADLCDIVAYTVDRWGKRQSGVYLDGLEASMRRLADMPGTGRRRDELHAGLRSFQFESHQIFYATDDDGIVILRVLHERMDVERHLT